jgi:TonB-dependent receptor
VKAPANGAVEELPSVLIVGARASQQSSIERKKNAATAMDSIIAEDVGDFPDRNVGEAISRIAGVALSRGDFGEGTSVTVRGNSADVTRVEIDGQGVQAGGGTDLLGGGEGRGVELRELSSDLIKSVDVVKGSTSDMTEGSLGGGIIIKSRTGLDFKEPYYSLRLGATQQSLIKQITPNANLVLSRKFLDNKLGVLLNVTKSDTKSEGHSLANGGTNNQVGMLRLGDFDNSPEKTFTYNPSTVSKTDPAATTPLLSSPLTAGGTFNSATPLELVTKSAAAQTKQDCYASFPALSATQLAAINTTANRNTAIDRRTTELRSCLNQWNDYTPSLIRSFVRGQDDNRMAADLRFDYKVNNKLSLYAKASGNKREVTDVTGSIALGQISFNNAAVNSSTYTGSSFVDTNGVRAVVPASNYTLLPGTLSASATSGQAPIQGATVSIRPGYTVDASHHVTSYTLSEGSVVTDIIYSKIKTDSQYLSTGGTYQDRGLKVEFMLGDAKSGFERLDRRGAYGFNGGQSTFTILPDGAWGTQFSGGDNFQLDYPKYGPLSAQAASAAVAPSATNPASSPAYTAAQRPLVTPQTTLTVLRALKSETQEKTAKVDLSYALSDKVPFLNKVKLGFNGREISRTSWSPGTAGTTVKEPVGTFGSASYIPGVYLPTVLQTNNVRGCEGTPTSLAAGGQPCAYGFNPSTSITNPFNGTTMFTQAGYIDLIKQTLSVEPRGQFYSGAKDRPDGLINGWKQIDIEKLYSLAGISTHMDCIVECVASDGKVYKQPVNGNRERSLATYLMTDFEIDRLPFTNKPLPFGMELSGNFGYRIVQTDVEGVGAVQFNSVRKNGNFDPLRPELAAGVTTFTVRQNTALTNKTTDIMPTLNLALWPIPNKLVVRYNRAKTVARPPLSKLIPNANCTFDERKLDLPELADGDDVDQACSNTLGNPGLKPYTNLNQNLSVEWYPNKDTMFSLSGYKQKGLIGAPTKRVTRENVKLFAGTDAVDPVSGTPLGDVEFTVTQWDNENPTNREGFEFSSKTAFTFLPSVLRYTGFDANLTKQKAEQEVPMYDLITGDELPIRGSPKYSYNASLWYDDGKLSARVALQVVATRFSGFSPEANTGSGVNNYPAPGVSVTATPYNPGAPIFANMTRYIDAKIGYKFRKGFEVFLEGRNLGLSRRTNSTGGYQDFSNGIPSVYTDAYSGARIMVGLNIRSL